MSKIAVFPGSFDPVTKGHEDILLRAIPLFDKIIIAIGNNSSKNYMFPQDQRLNWLKEIFKDQNKIEVDTYSGLTIDYCEKIGADYLLRGLRNADDYRFENNIAQMNKAMKQDIETVFLVTKPEFAPISSTIVRDIIRNKGNVSPFIPQGIKID